ncbi:MAG: gliding motility-associated C-terminal domain-containing protein [Hymenobacter sp.]|nr:MAG: gliding motility-associated C-terminal domain-containing protein [Hymenobacter sp.]
MAVTLASICRIPALSAFALPTATCPGQAVQLGLLVTGNGSGYTGQWQSSPDGITWTDVVGATASNLSVTPTVTTLYRYRATCGTSTTPSNSVTVTVTTPRATLAYSAASYCRTGTSGVPTATPAGGTFSAPAGLSLNATTGEINLATSTAGTYTVSYTSSGPCPATATAAITVVQPGATLAYGAASYCRSGSSSAPTATPAGGTFSAPAGLVVNASTGVLDLAASTAGTYTVSYTSGGQCPATATSTVTVVQPVAILTYGNSTYCRVGSSAPPAAAPAGGTFSAPAGLVVNASTGVLDLAASVAGTYTVTYTSGGQCPATATFPVLIKSDALPTFPNVLTPNGDGINDELRLRFPYPADVAGFRLQVFNRWGRSVFETGSPTQGWTSGSSSAGLYYYVVEYLDCANRRQYYKGWVEVMK